MKELKIEVPQGYEIDKEKSTFEKIVFKRIESEIKWGECILNKSGYFISTDATIKEANITNSNIKFCKNVFKNKSTAEAILALAQLEWLRDEYIKRYYTENPDWKPYWNNNNMMKYCIDVSKGLISKYSYSNIQKFLAFPTSEIRDKFFKEQRELIEQAKPLL